MSAVRETTEPGFPHGLACSMTAEATQFFDTLPRGYLLPSPTLIISPGISILFVLHSTKDRH